MTVPCRWVGAGAVGVESERNEGGMVVCSADATVVVHHPDPDRGKTPVCSAHADWLLSDVCPIEWRRADDDPGDLPEWRGA